MTPQLQRSRPFARLFTVLVLSALGLWLMRPAVAQGEGASSASAPSSSDAVEGRATALTVFLMRHAEKSAEFSSDPELSDEGFQRAEELARVLSHAGATHLFSTDYKRTRSTLGPIAKATGLEIASYDAREPMGLISKLRELPAGSVVVVSGHSNTTPALYKALSGKEAVALQASSQGPLIPEYENDRLYCVTLMQMGDEPLSCVSHFELRYGK